MIVYVLRSCLKRFPDFCFYQNYAPQIQGLNVNHHFLNVCVKSSRRCLSSKIFLSTCAERPSILERVKFNIVKRSGEKIEVAGEIGDSVMKIARNYDVGFEGCCEVGTSCCACHVYVDEVTMENLPSPETKEDDLLDNVNFLQLNSRLSCQILVDNTIEGACFTIGPK